MRLVLKHTNWRVKHEAVDSVARGENDHGGASVQGVTGGHDLTTWKRSFLTIGSWIFWREKETHIEDKGTFFGGQELHFFYLTEGHLQEPKDHHGAFWQDIVAWSPINDYFLRTYLKMAKMDPMETRQSMLELPSRGSNVTIYFPCLSVSTSISFSFSWKW